MRGNTFGKLLSITTFGESHGAALGVVVDGLPSKLNVDLNELKSWLSRRAPGQIGTTARVEKDEPEILSGIFEGVTLGTPIAVIVRNEGQRSSDYDALKDHCRPGHADQTTLDKFGVRDHRGGGRSSGRETLGRVIGGYFASLVVPLVKVEATLLTVAGQKFDSLITLQNYLEELKNKGESASCDIAVSIKNVQKGLGEPVFDKLKADLAKAMLSIGGCTSFSYGGDDFGGIEGGMSNGSEISFLLKFKAPSTTGEKAKAGRHDPCLAPRVLVVVEAMSFLVVADHTLRQRAYEV